MTIGEKIKYCRKQIGITQDKLAELTGIHPVSIRKYETNKMQPQPPQLEKIAAALGVSYNALNGSLPVQHIIIISRVLFSQSPPHKPEYYSFSQPMPSDPHRCLSCPGRADNGRSRFFCNGKADLI